MLPPRLMSGLSSSRRIGIQWSKAEYVHLFRNSCVKNAPENCLRRDAAMYTKYKMENGNRPQSTTNVGAASQAEEGHRRLGYWLRMLSRLSRTHTAGQQWTVNGESGRTGLAWTGAKGIKVTATGRECEGTSRLKGDRVWFKVSGPFVKAFVCGRVLGESSACLLACFPDRT